MDREEEGQKWNCSSVSQQLGTEVEAKTEIGQELSRRNEIKCRIKEFKEYFEKEDVSKSAEK